ncbi:NAD-dependent epimerase/dehydratase family protein [Jiangella aurantiaca]|uniref:NAD-dependent epimerase/dehydratase family protein n=1 Tax=Jiangella aurantiaca TaxID=2530373 RepID=A0A4R5AAF3_9ACTN|nr:NAD(P)H-binding protein [Jiangella aurantiaca]TDD68086.1 NAD-dependent epimerase/dehydratase family protein [Jiangella aurantiaca]
MIVVTGATGRFGPVVVEDLIAKVPAGEVAVVARDPEKAKPFADRGVDVRRADYDDPASLERAFKGADRLLFVSASDTTPGVRARQHADVVAAAAAAGVGHVVYTSAITAEDGQSFLADHTTTERAIRDAGLTHTFLRNTFYTEELVPGDLVSAAVKTGELAAPAIGHPLVTTPIADLALAASAVLTGDGHEDAVYELRGPGWTYPHLARILSELSGTQVTFREIADDDAGGMAFVLPLLRLPQFGTPTPDLERLLGRPATPLEEFVRALG